MTVRPRWPRLVPPRSYGPAWPQAGRPPARRLGTGACVLLLLLLLLAVAFWLHQGHHHHSHGAGAAAGVPSRSAASPTGGSTPSDSGPGVSPASEPPGPQTFRTLIVTHHHHVPIRLVWDTLWGLLSLVFLVWTCFFPRRPIRPDGPRLQPALGSLVLIAVACLLVGQAIKVPDSSNAPSRAEPITQSSRLLSDGDTEITEREHVHHFHWPTRVSVALLLLAGGLSGLGVRQGLTAARRSRKEAEQQTQDLVEKDESPQTPAANAP